MKTKPVVNQLEIALAVEQDMAALAVGVIDDQVKESHRTQAFTRGFIKRKIGFLRIMGENPE